MNDIDAATRAWLQSTIGPDFEIEKHAYSHQDDVYKIQTPAERYYLKIAPSLRTERDNLLRLRPHATVPDVLGFTRINGRDHLLMSELHGRNLAELAGELGNEMIVKEFARAIKMFHALDAHILFPARAKPGLVVLHGDMAMPNVLRGADGELGFIDLAQMSVGLMDVDLADAIWSLQRNIGPGYGELLLREYGGVAITPKLEAALQFKHVPAKP
ncbi:MAG TPA: phosphotransferase [Candidatus Saccharimonadales bacterium]